MANTTGFLVRRGSDPTPLVISNDRAWAERWARDYNANHPWSHADNKARVEAINIKEVDLDN